MNVIFTLLAAAEEPAAGGVGIQVLDYLKYGTLGLAGIILLLAFFLAQQANGLPEQSRMIVAQKGVASYMNVAKWLLIPCMGLQILSLFVGAKPASVPPGPKAVTAYVRVTPQTKDTETLYGSAGIMVGRGAKATKLTPKSEASVDVEIKDNDDIIVSLEDMFERLKQNATAKLPKLEDQNKDLLEPKNTPLK